MRLIHLRQLRGWLVRLFSIFTRQRREQDFAEEVESHGVSLGLGGALALTRLMKTLLFGVSATDPLTFIVIAASLIMVALLAC